MTPGGCGERLALRNTSDRKRALAGLDGLFGLASRNMAVETATEIWAPVAARASVCLSPP
jgi:hypothetical protein